MSTCIHERELFPFRPKPFYYITSHNPAELTYEAFYADLSDMKEKGYGGIVLFNRPPEGFSKEIYFTEAWFSMVGNCLRACRDLGLLVWLNDDYDAPPGTIGGRLEKIAPYLKPQRLIQSDGEIRPVDVPWGFPAFENPESALLFQKYVYEEYKRRFGEYFGTTVVGFFSDADSRRVNSCVYSPNSPMKDYFPWIATFPETFREKYGYDIIPYLPSILRREPSSQSHDYWEHCGELYMGWFESNYRWCQKNGLLYTFHTSDSAPFTLKETYFNSVFAEGKAIDAGRHADFCGVDHELLDLNGGRMFLRERYEMSAAIYGGDESLRRASNFYDVYADLRAKQAQSCAYLNDKMGVMCEMYAAVNWNASMKELRNIASWQIMQGVTFIVYQAYHYKLRGETKFFAPLSFGRHSHTDFDMKQFNDTLSDYAYRASRGRLLVDFALLDPTDAIWAGAGESKMELALAKELNRYPGGYVIADKKGILQKASELKAVINPGLPLDETTRAEFHALGLDVLEAEELVSSSAIEKRYPTGISWNGNGNVMFMRRFLEDGTVLLLAGNIEQEETLTGELWFDGKTYSVTLASGEIAFFGGVYTKYRSPSVHKEKIPLQKTVPVTFEKQNIVPLMRWEDENGCGFSLLEPSRRVSFIIADHWIPPHFNAENNPSTQDPLFPFTVSGSAGAAELLLSKQFVSAHLSDAVYFDNQPLTVYKETMILDDPYFAYPLEFSEGKHIFRLHLNGPISTADALYLRGNFDAELKIAGKPRYYGSVYSVQLYLPEFAFLTLSPRRNELRTDLSQTEQGQPFYSGCTDYYFTVDTENLSDAELVMDGLRETARVYLDGNPIASVIFPPYHIPLSLEKGRHIIRIQTGNTLGNMLEGFKVPSGFTKTPYLAF